MHDIFAAGQRQLLSISATIFKQFINIYLDIQGSGF
jgi:hypothetical protein